MGLTSTYRWLFAACYDRTMARSEQLCLGDWRRELLQQATGEVLEIGSGTGTNLPCYPATLTRLVLCEPDPFMLRKLRKKITASSPTTELATSPAERLDFADASFDTVVVTLVLCSVDEPVIALNEIRRVLRPGGKLLFLEHVRSDQASTRRWQHLWEPLWKCGCGNCHLTRDTAEIIERAGFELDPVDDLQMLGAPAIVRRIIRGVATNP